MTNGPAPSMDPDQSGLSFRRQTPSTSSQLPSAESSGGTFENAYHSAGVPLRKMVENPTITVTSVSEARACLEQYFYSDADFTLRLKLHDPKNTFQSLRELLFTFLNTSGQRFKYDAERGILKIVAMSNLHKIGSQFVFDVVAELRESGDVSAEEKELIRSGDYCLRLPTSGVEPDPWGKDSDLAIIYGDPRTSLTAPVVFEVGVSESQHDLVGDVKQYLLKSNGVVRVVVLINIQETERPLSEAEQQASAKRKNLLLQKYGNKTARLRQGLILDSDIDDYSYDSDGEMYDSIRREVAHEDWIGDVVASVQIWDVQNDQIRCRDSVDVLPRPSHTRNPELHITDIVPEKDRSADFNAARSFKINIDWFQLLLEWGCRDFAEDRAIRALRPRSPEFDGTYNHSQTGKFDAALPAGP